MTIITDLSNEFPTIDKEIQIEQKETIKLIKNTKGYNWEIKLIDSLDIESQIDRLERINNRLEIKFDRANGNNN